MYVEKDTWTQVSVGLRRCCTACLRTASIPSYPHGARERNEEVGSEERRDRDINSSLNNATSLVHYLLAANSRSSTAVYYGHPREREDCNATVRYGSEKEAWRVITFGGCARRNTIMRMRTSNRATENKFL